MDKALLSTEALYNIVMAIDIAPDFQKSLCPVLREIVQTVNGGYGIILLAQWNNNRLDELDEIGSYPADVSVQPEIRHIIEHTQATLVGQTRQAFSSLKPHRETLANGSCSYWFPLSDRGILILNCGKTSLSTADVVAMRGVCHKITRAIDQTLHFRKIHAELVSTRAKYKTSTAIIDDFLSVISHELHTPLALIMGFTETLLDGRPGPLTATQKRFLENSYKSSGRMLKIVDDLLAVTHLQQKHVQLKPRPLRPNLLVASLRETMQSLATEKAIILSLDNSWPAQFMCLGDQHWLEETIIKLVENAVKFTQAAKRVRVQSSYVDGAWVFRVIDRGSGIPTSDLPFMFDKFYRGRISKSTQSPGMGVGLSICKAVLAAHHGEIGIKNNSGDGATVWFKIPATPVE